MLSFETPETQTLDLRTVTVTNYGIESPVRGARFVDW